MADKQITIQEKWRDGGISILPPKKKITTQKAKGIKKEVAKKKEGK